MDETEKQSLVDRSSAQKKTDPPQSPPSTPKQLASRQSIAAIVLGLFGLASSLCCLIPVVNFFSGGINFVIGLVGLIMTSMEIKGKGQGPGPAYRPTPYNITGFILGTINILIGLMWLVIVVFGTLAALLSSL